MKNIIHSKYTKYVNSAVVLTLAFVVSLSVYAKDPSPKLPGAEQSNELDGLKFHNAPIDIVLKEYSEKTGRTLLIGPGINKINISLESQTALTVAERLQAIESVLAMHGVALLNVGDKFVKVVPIAKARNEAMPIVSGLDDEVLPETDELVSVMMPLKNIEIKEAQSAIKPLIHSTYGKVDPFERINSILITDNAANINRIRKIIEFIDQPIESREEPNVMVIHYAKAQDIKKTLEDIIADYQKDQKKSTTPRANRSGAPGFTTPSPAQRTIPGLIRAPSKVAQTSSTDLMQERLEQAERGVIRGKVKIVADERTNILIIITRPENMKFFEKVVSVLDVPTEPDVMVKVFRLEYADAADVASTLNDLIGKKNDKDKNASTAKNGKTEGRSAALRDYVAQLRKSTEKGTPEKSSVGELSAENIKILSDKRTNALLIMARKQDMAAIEDIISNMDLMLSQVLIEVVIIQVQLDDTITSGIQWVQRALIFRNTKKNGSVEPVSALAGSLGGGSGTAVTPAMKDAATLSSLGAWGAGGGLTSYFTHFGLSIDAILRLVGTDSHTTVISTPVVVTTDNTEAKIKSNQKKYFLTGSTVDQFGNTRPQTEIKDIGLELTVKPHINKSRNVTLEITQQASDEGSPQEIDGQKWPTMTERSFTANISVQDGETIVLGGLVRNLKSSSGTKVPILGSIPLLGRLFRSDTKANARGEVVVFVTPYVLNKPDEIEAESVRRKDALNIDGMWKKGWSGSKLAEPSKAEIKKIKKAAEEQEKEREQAKANEISVLETKMDKRLSEKEKEIEAKIKQQHNEQVKLLALQKQLKQQSEELAKRQQEIEEKVDVVQSKVAESSVNAGDVKDEQKEDPLSALDPELVEFIKRNEKKWDGPLKKIDKRVEKDLKSSE